MTGLHRKLFRDFQSLSTQVLTIAFLVLGGLSVLISSWSSYRSLESAKNQFYDKFQFADIFVELVRAPDSFTEKISNLQGVDFVESRIVKEGLVDVPSQVEPALGRFISWKGQHQGLNLIYLRQGRMPQPNQSQIEVVIHEAFAVAHRLRVGDGLKVLLGGKKRNLVISGIGLSPEYVYSLSPVAPLPDDKHFGLFWMHHTDLALLTGMSGGFNSLQVKVSNSALMKEIKRQMDILLQPFGSIQSYDRSQQVSHIFVQDEIRQQRVMAIFVPCIFLSVAMFILNILLSRIISLHRAPIATLKALGYSSTDLFIHYFQLVTMILFAGILPSLFCGAWLGQWYAKMYQEFFRFPSIDFSLSFEAIFFGIAAGLLPGWFSAFGSLKKVFSLQPAQALRPPSPPDFQKGLFEKLGLSQSLGLFSKMILRSMLFRPWRLILSILGIAASLAILINGSFWTDVIDFMIQRQFQEMHREDITVVLNHPRPWSVYAELKHLPGVVMVEGQRSVPIRIEFQNRKKETSMIGISENSSLSRLLDQKGNIVKPIQSGLVLSRYFESSFGLQKGDWVRLKVLQGKQQEWSVPVMAFVDDMMGQQVYVEKKDLHRWLNETAVVDTVHMKIDSMYSSQIYLALKERPEVLGITFRKLLLQSFTKTVGDMILAFTMVLFLFAIGIAAAVIYNSSRISFSERGWELASLRILGFEMSQTFEIIFLDLGLQVLLSIIPGLGMGYYLSYLSTNYIQNDTFKFPLIINPATYAMAVFVLMITYLLSGIYLYRKVEGLDFSNALKARE